MPEVGSEPMITVSEHTETVHALELSAAITGRNNLSGNTKTDDSKHYIPLHVHDNLYYSNISINEYSTNNILIRCS
jgi:hypothetical protein